MLNYLPIPTEQVRAYQDGGVDAYGHLPEKTVSDGGGNRCRHCLCYIPKGAEMLVLAHRPFPSTQPYAETGPLFLCADHCPKPRETSTRPEVMIGAPDLLLRGYDASDRIVYGTGAVVPSSDTETQANRILDHPDVAYVHVRSAANNCFRLRMERP